MIIYLGGLGANLSKRVDSRSHETVLIDKDQKIDVSLYLTSQNDGKWMNVIFGSAGRFSSEWLEMFLQNHSELARVCHFIAVLPFSFEGRDSDSRRVLQMLKGYTVSTVSNAIDNTAISINKFQANIAEEITLLLKA